MLRRLLCLAVLLVAAAPPPSPRRAARAARRPLVADLDGDGTNETVRLRETACFSSAGDLQPPCPNRDDVFRTILVEVADTCGRRRAGADALARDGRRDVRADRWTPTATARPASWPSSCARAPRGEACSRRSSASAPAPTAAWPYAGRCSPIRSPRRSASARAGPPSPPAAWAIKNFSSRYPGAELRTIESYARGNDPGCCPSYQRTTYWRFAPKSGSYTPYRTKLRKLR